ncbi:hypothetical protein ACFFS2_36080 [Streptomyces aurantiacus]|uniref:hypothetical protein n=1 Tax=Streptomyces aurantiacus TaxID=47760 RepID=UPI0012FF1D9F|nr:hypothetical protein [Streptomyces aurantiacus]
MSRAEGATALPGGVAVSHLLVYDRPADYAEQPSAHGRFGRCGRLDVYRTT